MKLLHVDSSILGAQSVSRELSAAIVQAWQNANPNLNVIYRDLSLTPLPQLSGAVFRTIRFGAEASPETAAYLALAEDLLGEFLSAEAIVIGAPMYNFSVPTQLKAWIDALAQPGRTFAYTPNGPKGLAGGKRVIIASSRGNIYSKPPANALDFQERYLTAVLNLMGITQIDTVRAEGVNLSPLHREDSLRQARVSIAELFAGAAVAVLSPS